MACKMECPNCGTMCKELGDEGKIAHGEYVVTKSGDTNLIKCISCGYEDTSSAWLQYELDMMQKEYDSTKFDYMTIPELRYAIKCNEELSDHEDPRVRRAANSLLYEKGTKLLLTVTVEDPRICQEILSGALYSGKFGLAGFNLESVNRDVIGKEVIRDYLMQQLLLLDEED